MKKIIAVFMVLYFLFTLVGCSKVDEESRATTPTGNAENTIATENHENITTETTVDWSEIPGGTRFIIEIHDRTEEEQLVCFEAEELFYEDEINRYYFNVFKSHYIMVVYNNGSSEDIATALIAGRATIADLDEFRIEYHTETKAENEVLQFLADKYDLKFTLWGPEGHDLYAFYIYPDYAERECYILMPENMDDVAEYYKDLTWVVVGNELIVTGKWEEAFKIDITEETATSLTTGKVYQIYGMQSE